MNPSNKLLSDLVSFRTYSKYLPVLSRREVFEETVNRAMFMHLDKFPKLSKEITKAFNLVHQLKVMPSMRSLQFGGLGITKNNARSFNCSFTHIETPRKFSEILFLLLSGTGVGFSIQKRHISQLPKIRQPTEEGCFVVQDSIQGWAQSVGMLMDAYFNGSVRPLFDFFAVRPKGALLYTTGSKAPGPEPLKYMLEQVEIRLKKAVGRHLKSIEIHDIICIISDCVLAGGIRRSSLISLFDRDDTDMLKAKSGKWYEDHPYRARANNSVVLPRSEVSKEEFFAIYSACRDSGAGEPGFFWTNDPDMGVNPCFIGSTLLDTSYGKKTLSDLVGVEDLVLKDMNGNSVDGKVWSNGMKEVISIRLSNGEIFTCTPDHIFMDTFGNEIKAQNLKSHRIMPKIEFNEVNDNFVKLGFLQGDAVLGRLDSEAHKGLEINIGEDDRDIAQLFGILYEEGKRSYYTVGYNEILKDLKFDPSTLVTRKFPASFDGWSKQQKLSFLRGAYSANGSVISGHRIAYKAVSFEFISKLSEVLTEFGFDNYITTNKSKTVSFKNGDYLCRQSYDLNISTYLSVQKFAKEIGFVHKYKQISLKELILEKAPMVLFIKNAGFQEVFDFSLQGDCHWGVVGSGFIAHNCCEISLLSSQFCNLSTVNQTGVSSKKDFLSRIYSAAFIGTLQASYTDFPFLNESWRKTTESEALLGVSFTGVSDANGIVPDEWLVEGAKLVLDVNGKYAPKMGINLAARATALKPEGSASCVLGSSSGIHARKSLRYIRRVQINKDDALYLYLLATIPDLIEDAIGVPNTAVISIPQESPKGAPTEDTETSLDLFDRVMRYNKLWVAGGHRTGANRHNVSCTLSVKDNEWDILREKMWNERDNYTGISLFPYFADDSSFKQLPFESCSEEKFKQYSALVKDIDLTQVKEYENMTNLIGTASCSGGACEVTTL